MPEVGLDVVPGDDCVITWQDAFVAFRRPWLTRGAAEATNFGTDVLPGWNQWQGDIS